MFGYPSMEEYLRRLVVAVFMRSGNAQVPTITAGRPDESGRYEPSQHPLRRHEDALVAPLTWGHALDADSESADH